MAKREIDALSDRRDMAYDALGDLFVERRRMLGFVSDNMLEMQEANKVKNDINEGRLQSHAVM